ncbi:hypothetical protein AWZ03_014123 [Drosophila navojoa]|uniref:Uncharacterized protein n=1 Tax=Drosophila navojoa TaxID=7232 RepID=A0A484ASS2_DRONA|nr:hypothetical protein AWZ03_014123 [Drosophila navojoa]
MTRAIETRASSTARSIPAPDIRHSTSTFKHPSASHAASLCSSRGQLLPAPRSPLPALSSGHKYLLWLNFGSGQVA